MPTFFLCILTFLSLFSFVFTLSAAEASNHNLLLTSTLRFPKKQAEKFIRELNLFPGHDVNVVEDDPEVNAPRIVEKRFQFPHLSDSAATNSTGATVQEFGHHAGYYRLPHTKGARYICMSKMY